MKKEQEKNERKTRIGNGSDLVTVKVETALLKHIISCQTKYVCVRVSRTQVNGGKIKVSEFEIVLNTRIEARKISVLMCMSAQCDFQ